MKKIKKVICSFLILAICIQVFSISNNSIVEASGDDMAIVFNPNEEFYKAPDDTVVFYYDSIPIKKSQIFEKDGQYFINMGQLNKISLQSSGPQWNTVTIPSRYNEAIVKTHLTAPQFSQVTIKSYLNSQNGAKFASSVETGNAYALAGLFGGFIPVVGPVIAITFTINGLYKAEVAKKIRSHTNNGYKVEIREVTSSYGTFYSVFRWTGRTIETNSISNGPSKEVILGISYR